MRRRQRVLRFLADAAQLEPAADWPRLVALTARIGARYKIKPAEIEQVGGMNVRAALLAPDGSTTPAAEPGPAAALKAALATNPLSPPADVLTIILTFAAGQIAAGGPMWRLRCSPAFAQAHRFPGAVGVEVMRDWLSGRWELADAGGQVIVTSGGGAP